MDKYGSYDLSPKFRDEVNRISNNAVSKTLILGIIKHSEKLVRYAILYMSENLSLISFCKKDREFINSISNYVGYGKIFKDDEVSDIDRYEITKLNGYNVEDNIVFLEELDKRLFNEDFTNKWKTKLNIPVEENISKEPIDLDTPVKTVFSVIDDEVYDPYPVPANRKPVNMPDKAFELFEDAFKDLIDVPFWYDVDEYNNYILLIKRNNYNLDWYLLDDGRITGGNRASLYVSKENGSNTFVPVKENIEIIKKFIANTFYKLSASECDIADQCAYFDNPEIYQFVDLSNTELLANCTKESIHKMERRINGVIKTLKSHGIVNCRLRFEYFKSTESFKLVSDNRCLSSVIGLNYAIYNVSAVVEENNFDLYIDNTKFPYTYKWE